MRRVDHTDYAAVLEHGRCTTSAGGKTLNRNWVQGVAGRERGSGAIGGVTHQGSVRRAREPVGRYKADVSPMVDDG